MEAFVITDNMLTNYTHTLANKNNKNKVKDK